jgi:predicted nucleic acid-binding protein
VNLLLDVLDEGEAEALVQASTVGAAVFIGDEKAGRTMSLNRGIRPIGTARLLARLHVEGLAADAMTLMKKLKRDLGCYVADRIVHDAISDASKPF